MRRIWQVGLALLVVLAAAGCQGASSSSLRYEEIPLAEAPGQLQAKFQEMRAVPGLFVLENGGETYLLLTAGRSEVPGRVLELVDLRRMPNNPREVRLIASLRPESNAGDYVSLALRVQASGLEYIARVPAGEQVTELRGVPLTMQ
jgi:hypothetical protein